MEVNVNYSYMAEDVAVKPDDLAAWLAWLEELDRRVKTLEAKQVKRCGYCGQVIE